MVTYNNQWHSPPIKLIVKHRITPKTHSHFHSSMIKMYQKHYKKQPEIHAMGALVHHLKLLFSQKNGPRHLQTNQKGQVSTQLWIILIKATIH